VRPLEIESVRENHGGFLIKFKGVDNLAEAEKLRAHSLAVPDDELVELEEDEYWHWQLEGLKAFSPDGQPLGVLKEVVQSPAHDLYLVETSDGKTHWVPAVRQYVPEIDVENGRVVVILPEMDD
jgi:16S rRNA processing protein RimM